MIGLDKLQLFSPSLGISSEGEDFYAPMIRSFGSFYIPSNINPEGGYETFTYLEVSLEENSSNDDNNYIYRGVYVEGIINPISPTSPFRNYPFHHYALYTWEGNILQDYEYPSPIASVGTTPLTNTPSIDSTSFRLNFNLDLLWESTPQDDPLFKVSGIYYTI